MKVAAKHLQTFAFLTGINVVLTKARDVRRLLLFDENTNIFFFFAEVIRELNSHFCIKVHTGTS